MNEQENRPGRDCRIRTDRSECLPIEKLSAELDGEYHFCPEEKAHLKQCPKCRGLHESYRLLDDAVSNALSINCPAAAARRIRKSVNRQLGFQEPEQFRHPAWYSTWQVRAAAIAVSGVAAGYLLLSAFNPETPKSNPPAMIAGTQEKTNFPMIYSSGFGGVDMRHLRLTTAGNASVIRFTENEPKVKAERIAVIPPNVKHIWLFDPGWTPEKTEKTFRSVMEKAGIPLNGVILARLPDRGMRITMNLTRYQLVMLTRQLAENRLTLVSPAQPQPEQKLFAGTGKEKVNCEIVLIPRGK